MIELSIGSKLLVNGVECMVTESRACSNCEIHKMTSGRKFSDGTSLQCGTKYGGNTSDFSCSKDMRTDNKNIIFKKL